MATTFLDLKERREADFERIRGLGLPLVRAERKRRVKRAGSAARRSLLMPAIAKTHGKRLKALFVERLGDLDDVDAQNRLRLLTVLHDVEVMDLNAIAASVGEMEASLKAAVRGDGDKSIWMLGAVEIELVSLGLLKSVKRPNRSESRKLAVFTDMLARSGRAIRSNDGQTHALIHFHGIIDLGDVEDHERHATELRDRLVSRWPGSYAIQLKRTFKNRPVGKNLEGIANYLTKGGNEQLRYKTGFGRDEPFSLDAEMRRSGFNLPTRLIDPNDVLMDEFALTSGDVRFLGKAYDWLMRRKSKTDGYLVVSSPQGRPLAR